MENGVIAKGEVLSDSNEQQWMVDTFIGVNGRTKSYIALSCNDTSPTNLKAILLIIPTNGDEPLPIDFQFYLDSAKPQDFDDWKRVNKIKQDKHLGIPCLLGTGHHMINDLNYRFIVIQGHGKNLLSLFLENGKKFKAHTAYKITLQLITILKYTHTKLYIHGDIKSSNIVLDIDNTNKIYLMDDYITLQNLPNDDPVDSNKTCDDAVVISSRDSHMGAPTMRGDMETVFHNLVQWLGIELPWQKHCKNPSLMLEEKNKAFANVQNWSEKIALPHPVCKFMELLAIMDTNDKPIYSNFVRILVNGLKKLHHVPYGKLEFCISDVLTVEQIEDDTDQVNKPQRRCEKLTAIPKLGNSVLTIASIISENCRHEGEVRLREIGSGSLIEIICDLTCRKKDDSKWQNILANAWERDIAEMKTMTRRLWREKGLQAKETTSGATPMENQHEEPSQGSTARAAASAQEDTNALMYSNLGASDSQNRCDATSPDGIPPQEHAESFHLSNISPPMVRLPARSPSLSRWSGVQSSPIGPSTSGYSSRSSIQGDSYSEAMTLSRTPEHFYDTEHNVNRNSEIIVVKVKQETNRNDVQVTECQRSESASCQSWQDKYKMLNAWLKMKEQNFVALGSIPSEPQMVADQVQQVRVLLDEFHRSLRLRQLKSTQLPPDSDNSQDLESLLEQVEQRWWNLLDRLEVRGKELGDASLKKLRDDLQDVSYNLDHLSLDNDQEEQRLSKIEMLSGQLEGFQRTLLADTIAVAGQLCQALRNQAYTSDLRVQLRSVRTLYSNLQQQLRIKRVEIESNLNDGRQFDDSCKETHVWLVKELANILEKPLVSTDRTTLQRQHDHYKIKHQLIMDRETVVMELLERGRNRLRPQNSTQQRFLESIESQWDRLIRQSLDVVNKLNTCVESCDKFYHTRDLFVRWLSEAERNLESIKPATLDDIAKQLKELYELRDEVGEKSGEFEQYIDLGRAFIGICDLDEDDLVKNQLSSTKDIWTKLNCDMVNRLQSFEDMGKRFAKFNKSLLDLQKNIERLEKESASYDASETAVKDSQVLHRIKELKTQVRSLQEPRDVIRQQVDDLVLQYSKQEINASHLLEGVNRLDVRIENLTAKFDCIHNDILEQEHARFVKEIQNDKPVESPSCDSSKKEYRNKPHCDMRQDRDSDSNGRGKKQSESSSRSRRSRSNDLVSSLSKPSTDSSKSHRSHKYDDSRSNSDLNPSQPKRVRNSRDSNDRDSQLPRHDRAKQDTSNFRNTYNESNRSPLRNPNQKCYRQKSRFYRRPIPRGGNFSNTLPNLPRRDRAQSVSHCDSRFGRDFYGWSPRWNYCQDRPIREIFGKNNASRQVTTARNWESNAAEERKRQKEQDDMNKKYPKSDESGKDQQTGLEGENQQEKKE